LCRPTQTDGRSRRSGVDAPCSDPFELAYIEPVSDVIALDRSRGAGAPPTRPSKAVVAVHTPMIVVLTRG
jgi:hypothetical protein